MASIRAKNISGSGTANAITLAINHPDNRVTFQIYGTYAGWGFRLQGSPDFDVNSAASAHWDDIAAFDQKNVVWLAGGTDLTPGSNAVYAYVAEGTWKAVRIFGNTGGTGIPVVSIFSDNYYTSPPQLPQSTSPTLGSLTLTGLLFESAATGITAGTTRTQAGATALSKEVNRVDTSTAPAAGATLGDGVALPASAAGLDITVINNTANIITVYPANASGDQINGQGANIGVPIPPGDVAQFESAIAGDWRFDPGVGAAGVLPVMIAADSVSAAGANQGAATQLVADFNRVTTATANQGVKLPASAAGLDVIVENHSGVAITVYGAGTDKIDDVASATGVTQMDSSVVIYTCYAPGNWYSNGLATGYAKNPQSGTVLETMQYADNLTALGTSQGTALQLLAGINTVATVASGTGVNLPASAPGLQVTVINTGVNALAVYPAQSSSDTINGQTAANGIILLPGTVATFNSTAAGAWTVQPGSTKSAAFNTNTQTAGNTLTAAQVTGGVASVDLAMTGTLGAGANAQLPTVAAMVLALHTPTVGTSFRLRIINESSANFAWTITTNTGWTLTGTMTIAQNTWREFVVTLNSLTTATLQSVATGTFS